MKLHPNDNIDTSEFFEPEETIRITSDFTDITPIPPPQDVQTNRWFVLYKAQRYGQWWALKCVSHEAVNQSLAIEILRKEFEVGIGLWHPNIVRMLSKRMDLVDGAPGIVEEYVDGLTLYDYLRTQPPEEIRIQIAEQIISAMEYYMSKQVVHCDLKPSNILITHIGHLVKIVDFGLSNRDAYNVIRGHGGTDVWAAPEQSDADGVVDCRADFYSFGKIMQLLKLPRRFNHIVRKCLKPRPADRYAHAMELRLAFEKAKSTLLPRWTLALSAACVALIVAAFVGGHWMSQNIVRSIPTTRDHIVDGEVPALFFGDTVDVRSDCDEAYITVSATKIFYRSNHRSIPGDIPASEAVDLGLSVDWAPYNVGCNLSLASYVGGYYNWGDATGKNTERDPYAYEVARQTASISGTDLDIATRHWGNGWRTPTIEEMRELVKRCKWTLVEKRGMLRGYIVTGPSGKSIFLPFAGYREGAFYNKQGLEGLYWSATPSTKLEHAAAYFMFLDSDLVSIDLLEEAVKGYCIRPVRAKQK